jgi:phage gpG-like protein
VENLMPGLSLSIVVKGAEELGRKLQPDKLLGAPLKRLFSRAALLVEREAKQEAPVKTGRLRSSITSKVSPETIPLWAKVGTNVEYASFVEYGHRQEVGRYVPAIGKRLVQPFVAARPFMAPAYEKVKDTIRGLMDEVSRLIEERWRGH